MMDVYVSLGDLYVPVSAAWLFLKILSLFFVCIFINIIVKYENTKY